MNELIRLTLIIGLASAIGGCATTKSASAPAPKEVSTKYTKRLKVASTNDATFKRQCPAEREVKAGTTWQDVVAMANACVKASNWLQVENLGNHLAKTEILGPWGVYYLSLAALERKEFTRSLWMVEAALKKAPSIGLFYYQRGRVLWAMNEVDAAVAAFEESLRLDSKNTEAHFFVGQIYLKDLDFKRAAEHLEVAVKADRKNPVALDGLSYCYGKLGKFEEAVELLETAMGVLPRRLDLRMRQALILEVNLKDEERALEAYRQVRYLVEKKRVDGSPELPIDEKIKTLEVAVSKKKAVAQKQVSLVAPEESKGEVTK